MHRRSILLTIFFVLIASITWVSLPAEEGDKSTDSDVKQRDKSDANTRKRDREDDERDEKRDRDEKREKNRDREDDERERDRDKSRRDREREEDEEREQDKRHERERNEKRERAEERERDAENAERIEKLTDLRDSLLDKLDAAQGEDAQEIKARLKQADDELNAAHRQRERAHAETRELAHAIEKLSHQLKQTENPKERHRIEDRIESLQRELNEREHHGEHRDREIPEELERRIHHLHVAADNLEEAGEEEFAHKVRKQAELELHEHQHGRGHESELDELRHAVRELQEEVELLKRKLRGDRD